MREPDECDGLEGQCGLAKGHAEPCRTCFVASPETFREVPPASPLAALKGATERMEGTSEEARRALCSPDELATLIRAGQAMPPTPAAMLAEALGLLSRLETIVSAACGTSGESLYHAVIGLRREVWKRKCEAEAKHGR